MSRRQIKLTVSPDLHEEISKAADRNGLPLSTFVREITRDWIDAKLSLNNGGIKSKIEEISNLKDKIKGSTSIENITDKKDDLVLLSELLKGENEGTQSKLDEPRDMIYKNSKEGETDISLGKGSGNQINITIRLDK